MRSDAIYRATTRRALSRRSFLTATGLTGLAAALSACGSDDGGSGGGGSAAVDWWHIQNLDPLRSLWAKRAKDFQQQNSGTKVNVTVLENEAFKTRLTTTLQANEPPDMFQSWGGGVLAAQVESGMVQDLTEGASAVIERIADYALEPYTIDGKVYGVPWTMGMVGFWYNRRLFEQAGVSEAPTTWAAFLDAVERLKAAGTTPIALAGADQWPAHFYWTYLAMRQGGIQVFEQAEEDRSVDAPAFVRAGEQLLELVRLEPFQSGFQNSRYTEGGDSAQAVLMGNGQAAIELMGQWAPGTQASATGGEGLGDDLAFFTFPAVDGGQGAATEVLGGGDGWAVGRDAPPETLEFLEFFFSEDNYREAAQDPTILTVLPEASDTVTDQRTAVLEALEASTGFQLYLDQDWPPAVGQQINASVAELIAGSKTPDQVVQEVTEVWQREG